MSLIRIVNGSHCNAQLTLYNRHTQTQVLGKTSCDGHDWRSSKLDASNLRTAMSVNDVLVSYPVGCPDRNGTIQVLLAGSSIIGSLVF